MTIRIGSNTSSLLVQRNLADANTRLANSFERLSSGQRINKASDDAAGLAISSGLQVKSRVYTQGIRNLSDSLSVTSVSREALDNLNDISIRQRELAEQSSNGVYSSQQRAALNDEAKALTAEYNRIVSTTKFNDQEIFTQNWQGLTIQAGIGADSTIELKIGDELASKLTAGSYFVWNGDGKTTCVYFNVDGEGTAPSIQADRYIGVNVATRDQVEVTDLTMPTIPGDLSYWDYAGYCLGGINSTQYYVWFDNGRGYKTEDFSPSDVGIRVDVTSISDSNQLAEAITQAVNNASVSFSVTNLGGGTVRVSANQSGDIDDSWDDYSGIMSSVVQQGQATNCSGSQIASSVAQALKAWGISAVTDGSNGVKITGSLSGNYVNAQNVNSNAFVDAVQNGTGVSYYSAGTGYGGGLIADFNNDGINDLATDDYGEGVLSIRYGVGDGTFGAKISYATGGKTGAARAADMNGDGLTDIVVANFMPIIGGGPGSVCVLLNQGNGAFSVQPRITLNTRAQDLDVADIDKDGIKEIIAAGYSGDGSKSVAVLENDGHGSLSISHEYNGPTGGYGGISIADYNGDGNLDFAVAALSYSNTMAVWQGNGTGSFSLAHTFSAPGTSFYLSSGDINGDGYKDLAYNCGVRLNDGHGDFSTTLAITDCSGNTTIADMNGDGLLDLAVAGSGKIYVKLNKGGGNFASAVSYTADAASTNILTGDLNSDGKSDLVVTNWTWSTNLVAVRLNNGNGTFNDPRGEQKEITWLSFGDARGRCNVENIDLTTRNGALTALNVLEKRINKINNEIGSLGASESRLEVAHQALEATRDNYVSASSRITDVDIAQTTAEGLRQQILRQIGSAMLAQANQSPRIALQLLKG